MGLFTKDIRNRDGLFIHQLKDIYYAKKRIIGALPKMIGKASSLELKQGFAMHLDQTKNHVKRVEQVFELHGVPADTVTRPAIDGIIKEADEVAGDIDNNNVLDAALSPRHRPSNITRLRATAHLSPGPRNSAPTTSWTYSTRISRKRRKPTRS
jgi:hypothetical protein